jgi:hypothetical protein
MGWETRFTTGLALVFALGLRAKGARAQDLFPPLEWTEEEHVRALPERARARRARKKPHRCFFAVIPSRHARRAQSVRNRTAFLLSS